MRKRKNDEAEKLLSELSTLRQFLFMKIILTKFPVKLLVSVPALILWSKCLLNTADYKYAQRACSIQSPSESSTLTSSPATSQRSEIVIFKWKVSVANIN